MNNRHVYNCANRRTWQVYGRADRRTWQTKELNNEVFLSGLAQKSLTLRLNPVIL